MYRYAFLGVLSSYSSMYVFCGLRKLLSPSMYCRYSAPSIQYVVVKCLLNNIIINAIRRFDITHTINR